MPSYFKIKILWSNEEYTLRWESNRQARLDVMFLYMRFLYMNLSDTCKLRQFCPVYSILS